MLSTCILVAALAGSLQDPLAHVQRVESRHYDLYLDMPEARRDDTVLLVEAAWKAFGKELDAKPGSKISRAKVRFYRSEGMWKSGMEYEQVFALPGHQFVHFDAERNTVYVHGMGGLYHGRKMMLYGLFLQFHRGSKPKNENLGKEWFITGMADALSTHRWRDGKLELGARRLLQHENRARLAIDRDVMAKLQDGKLSPQELSDWDLRWALTAFLLHGGDRGYRKSFQRRALGSNGSMLLGQDVLSCIGKPQEIVAGMDIWIREQARCLTPKLGKWSEEGDRLEGAYAGGRGTAIALADEASSKIEAMVTMRDAGGSGLLLDYSDSNHYTMAVLFDNALRIWKISSQELDEIDGFSMSKSHDREIRLRAEVKGDEVRLYSDKSELGRYPCPSGQLGLVSTEGRGQFRSVLQK